MQTHILKSDFYTQTTPALQPFGNRIYYIILTIVRNYCNLEKGEVFKKESNIQLFTFDFLIKQLYNRSQGFPSEEDNYQLKLFMIMGRRA